VRHVSYVATLYDSRSRTHTLYNRSRLPEKRKSGQELFERLFKDSGDQAWCGTRNFLFSLRNTA